MAVAKAPSADIRGLEEDDTFFTSEPFDEIDNNLFSGDDTVTEILDIKLSEENNLTIPKETLEIPSNIDILKETIKNLKSIPLPPPGDGDNVPKADLVLESRILESLKSSKAAQQKFYMVRSEIEKAVSRARLAKLEDKSLSMTLKLFGGSALTIGTVVVVTTSVLFGAGPFLTWLFSSGNILTSVGQNLLVMLVEKSFYTNASLLSALRQNLKGLELNSEFYQAAWDIINSHLTSKGKNLLQLESSDWTEIKALITAAMPNKEKILETIGYVNNFQVQLLSMILSSKDITKVEKSLEKALPAVKAIQNIRQIVVNYDVDKIINLIVAVGELGTDVFTLAGKSNFIFKTAQSMFECSTSTSANKLQRLLAKLPLDTLLDSEYVKGSMFNYLYKGVDQLLTEGSILTFRLTFPIEYEDLGRPLRAGEVVQEKKYFYFITGSDIRKNITGAIINTASNQAKAVVDMSIDSLFGKEIPEEKKKAKADDDDDKSPKTLRIRELIKEQKSLKEIEELIAIEFPIPVPPEDLTLYPTDDFLIRFTKEFKQGIRNIKELYKNSDGFLLTTSLSAFVTISMGVLFDYSTKPSSFSQEYMLGRFRFYLFPIISVLNNVLDHKIFRNLPSHLNPMVDEITRIIKTLTKEILRYLFSFVSSIGQKVADGAVYLFQKIQLTNKKLVLNYAEILIKGLFEILGAVGKGVSYLSTDILMVGVDREAKTVIRNASFMMKDISLDSIWTYLNTFNTYYNSIVSGIVSVKGWLGLSTAHLHEFGHMILEQNSMHIMKTGVDIIHKKTDCNFSNYASNTVYGFKESTWTNIGYYGGTLANFLASFVFKIPTADLNANNCYIPNKATISLGNDMVVTSEDPLIADMINESTEILRSVYNLYFAAVTEGLDPGTFAATPEFEDFYKRLGTGITESIKLDDIKLYYTDLLQSRRPIPIQSLESDLFNLFRNEVYRAWSSNVKEATITAWLETHPKQSRDDYLKQEFQTKFPHLAQWDPTNRIQLDANLSDYSLLPEQIQEVNKRMFELVTENFTSELRTSFTNIYKENRKFDTNFVYSYTSNGEDKTILFIREDSSDTQRLSTLDLNNLPEELKDQKDELTSMSQLGYTIRYIDNKTMTSSQIEGILSTLQTSPVRTPYETKNLGENTDFMDVWRAHVNETSTTSGTPLKIKFLSRFDNASMIQNLFVGGAMKGSSVFMDINGGFNIFSTYKDAEYAQFTEEEMSAARQLFAEMYIQEDNREEFIRNLRSLPDVSKTIAQLGRSQKRTEKSLVKAYRSMRRNIFASMPGIFNILNLNSIHSLEKPVEDIDIPTALLQNLLGHPDPSTIKKPATVSTSNYALWIQEEFNKLTNTSDKSSTLWYILLSVDNPNFQKEITRILAIPSTMKPTDILKNPSFLSFIRNALNGDVVSLQPIKIGTFTISTSQLTDLKNSIQSSKTNLLAKDSKDPSNTYEPLPYIAKKLEDTKMDPTNALPINIIANNNNLEPLNDFIFIQHFLEEQEILIKAANNDFSKLPNIITLDPQKYINNFFGLDKASEILGLKSQYDVILQGLIDNTRTPTQTSISFYSIQDSSKCAETISRYSEAANKYVYLDPSIEERQRLFTFLNEWLSQVKDCISKLIKQQQTSKIKEADELFTDINHFDRMSSWLQNEWKNTKPTKKMTKEQIQEKWVELTGGALHIPLGPIDSQAAIHNFNITLTIFADYTATRDQDFIDSVLEDIRTKFQMAFPSDTAFFTGSSQGAGGAPQGSGGDAGSGSTGPSGAGGAGAQQQEAPSQSRSTGQQTRQTTTRATGQAVRETSILDQKQILETSSNALDTAISEAISNIISSIQSLLNSLTSLTAQLSSSFGGTPKNVAAGKGRGNSLAGLGTGRRTDERVEAIEDIQEQCFKYRDHYVLVGKDKIKITRPQGLPPNITESFLSRCPLDSAAATALDTYLSVLRNAVKGTIVGIIGVAIAIRILCSLFAGNPLCAAIFFWMTRFIARILYVFVMAYEWVKRVDDYYAIEINRMKQENGQVSHEQFHMGKYFLEKPISTQEEQNTLVKDMTSVMMVVGSEFVFDSMKSFIGEFMSLIAASPFAPLLTVLTPILINVQHILSLKESKRALYGSGNTEYNIKGRWIPKSNTHKIVGQGRFFVKQASIIGEWTLFMGELVTTVANLGSFLSAPGAMLKLDNIFNWQSFKNGSIKSLPHILGDYTTEDMAFIAEYGDEGTPAQGNVNPWDVLGRFLNRMDKNTMPHSTYTNNIKTKIIEIFAKNYDVNVHSHIVRALLAYNRYQVCIDAFNSSRINQDITFEATINVYNVNGNLESTEKKTFITQFSSFPKYSDVNAELLTNVSGTSDYQKIESFLNDRNQYNTEIKDSSGSLLDPTQWSVKEFDPCELAQSTPVKLNIEVRTKLAVLPGTSQAPPSITNKSIKLLFKEGEVSILKQYYDSTTGDGNRQIKKYSTQESQDNRYILPVETLTDKSSSIFRKNTNRRILKGIQIEYQPDDIMGKTMWEGYQNSELNAFERTLQENTRGSKTTTNILPFFNRDVLPPIIDPNRFNQQAFIKDSNGKIRGLNPGTYYNTLMNDYVQLDNFKSIDPNRSWYQLKGYNYYEENPIWLLKRDVESFNALYPHLSFDQAKQQFADRYNKILMDTYASTAQRNKPWRTNNIDMTTWFEYNFIFSSAKQHPNITVGADHSVEFNANIISAALTDGEVLRFNDDNSEIVEEIYKSSNNFALD